MKEEEEVKINRNLKSSSAIAQYMSKSVNTIYNQHRDMNLPMYLIGGIWYADTEDLDEWTKHQKEGKWYNPKKVNHKVSEAAEEMAVMNGVDPMEVKGSGKEGAVVRKDIVDFIKAKEKAKK